MSGLISLASKLLAEPRDRLECPDCGGLLEQGYQRSVAEQGHWRGIPALKCDDCGYARRDAERADP